MYHQLQAKAIEMILQYLVQEATHISNIRKLKANFCGREKEGHFHYKKLFESFKMSTHMIGPNHGHKIPLLWLKAYPG